MRIEQIEIKTDSEAGTAMKVLAIATDMFAIHPTNGGGIGWDDWNEGMSVAFTLTHRPTGYAVVSGRSWNEVLGYWSEIHARDGIDWSQSDPRAVQTTVGPIFRDIKNAVEARMLAPDAGVGA